ALGDLLGDPLADGTGDDLPELPVLRLPLHRGALGRDGALGDDDDREGGVRAVTVLEVPRDPVDVEGFLGGEDDLRAAGDPGLDGDPTRGAPHELDDHDAVVALRRRVDAVDGLGGDVDGGVEADRAVRAGDVVV